MEEVGKGKCIFAYRRWGWGLLVGLSLMVLAYLSIIALMSLLVFCVIG